MNKPSASSICPVCGTDTPHGHTFEELTREKRQPVIRALFEKRFGMYLGDLPGFHKVSALTMFHKADNHRPDLAYAHEGIDMLFRAFEAGVEAEATGKLPKLDLRTDTPTLAEALTIKEQRS